MVLGGRAVRQNDGLDETFPLTYVNPVHARQFTWRARGKGFPLLRAQQVHQMR